MPGRNGKIPFCSLAASLMSMSGSSSCHCKLTTPGFKDPPVVLLQRRFGLSRFVRTGSRLDTHRSFPGASFSPGAEGRGLQLRIMYGMSVKLQISNIYRFDTKLSVMVSI